MRVAALSLDVPETVNSVAQVQVTFTRTENDVNIWAFNLTDIQSGDSITLPGKFDAAFNLTGQIQVPIPKSG